MSQSTYQTFHTFAGFTLHSPSGYLRISGPHQLDFLQRQTTNDLHQLSEKRALLTVLTSPTARLLDVFYLMQGTQADEPVIDALSLTGNSKGMAGYLKSRIFFMDRVSVADLSPDFVQLSLGGPHASDVLIEAGLAAPRQVDEIMSASLDGVDVFSLRQDPRVAFPYRLIIPSGRCEAVKAALLKAGAVYLSPDIFEILRLEAGLPAASHELVEAYTPLELNLESAVSDTKGCYTGQEVLARQRTYDKVTRKLVGLRLEAPVNAGDEVLDEERSAGSITSAGVSPRFGPLALAVLRRPFSEPGSQVRIKIDGQDIKGVVHSLPFT
jgi:folate-binding protein YgfZ